MIIFQEIILSFLKKEIVFITQFDLNLIYRNKGRKIFHRINSMYEKCLDSDSRLYKK